MSYELWTAVDHYFDGKLVAADPALEEALKATVAAGIPSIQVSATQGKLLHLLARIRGASRILEVGTLGGYSTIWLARALPADGRLVTLEVSPRHAAVATANVARAGLADVVDIRVGPALDTLPKLAAEAAGPFDLVFIDADKVNNPAYFQWAVKLTKPGSVIIVDNVVREGQVANPDSQDPSVVGTRELLDLIAAEPRVSATAVQTVGNKGYDGFTLALVTGE
ncbi:O-methyltransferase [Pseudofrankia inefficax]|uniref:O-methyltransferase family 3 n=1 Tax=Pseudofrankia inefficax (strain DSM 45817 / CECT 9037 / DDB 130130 / EuI1c) TaxID=298654 RepID=E3J2Z1_PSEI1|nr:O-methyltransferase [Pseudofrankia inefficax]ADP82941.1 O-methyltransferase family 3 [Pseudofrankia inefficax]